MTVAPILISALRGGAIFAGAVAVIAAVVGLLVDGGRGLAGGLLGALFAAVYFGLTAASMLVAARVTAKDPGSPVFYGIVLGSWVVKLVLFVIAFIWLRGQDWLNPLVFAVTVIVGVIGSLVVDMLAVHRSRVPYVSDIALPGDSTPPETPSARPPTA